MIKYKAQLLMLIASAGTLGAVSANAMDASSPVSPQPVVVTPAPVPTLQPKPNNEIEGRCRFDGVFNGDGKDKGAGFAIQCRARFEIELKENSKPTRDKRDEDFLRLECNGERVYSGDVKVRLRDDHDGHGGWDTLMDRDRDETLVLTGKHGDPRIVIKNVDLRDLDKSRRDDNDNLRSTLKFTANGYSYVLQGSCDLDREKNNRPEWDFLK